MPSRVEITERNGIDIGKRYDIYATEGQRRVVVYRNAFFRGMKSLEKGDSLRLSKEFYEIEQSNGESVVVSSYAVIKFCDAGGKLTCEVVSASE